MCWFTLTPTKGKKRHHGRHSTDSSCVEELVRVHRSPSPRFSDVRVKVPSSITVELEHHDHLHPRLHHHHKHHLHPLHLHPIHGHHDHHHDMPAVRLRGPGRKRCPLPPGAPPPSRDPSTCRPCSPSSSPARPREPIYRTQIVEPAYVRETTRVALRSVQPERQRSRLRRVAGYEVLGREVPWNWDCVSSTLGSSSAGSGKWTRKRRGGGLRYPPFGTIDRWL